MRDGKRNAKRQSYGKPANEPYSMGYEVPISCAGRRYPKALPGINHPGV
jgi:hypothetical protein